MSYTPQTWADGSGGGTPLSAARLSHMEAGIEDADTRLSSLTKADVGLGSVDNTADTAKPVSTAQASFATSRAVAMALVLGS